ncbi:hypothetical protein GJ744_000083 [Endocarpon pusillum]|uniref:Uncharacterized protein n=1 Tax=Endocarpon pusillum TaxID=364733 RepID=A0A8H7AS23_9EURO|nr:hypothetical protein GJ744_000083 [Endocarpon pusillum]
MCFSTVSRFSTCGHVKYSPWPGTVCPKFGDDPMVCPDYHVVKSTIDENCVDCKIKHRNEEAFAQNAAEARAKSRM